MIRWVTSISAVAMGLLALGCGAKVIFAYDTNSGASAVEERAKFRDELDASLPAAEQDQEFIAMINARVAAAEAGEPDIPA